MKKILILGYKDWCFREDEQDIEAILPDLFKETTIEPENHRKIVLKKREFHGDNILFYYYSPLSLQDDSAECILQEIKKDIDNHKENIAILLHSGTGDISFFHLQSEQVTPFTLKVKTFFFSGGNGITYHQLLNKGGTIFPAIIRAADMTRENIESALLLVWEEYFNGQEAAERENEQKLNR